MSAWIDVTWPLDETLAMWPGDTPLRYVNVLRMADGASVNLGSLTLSLHAGTHADAPRHFTDAGETIDALDLDAFIGPAFVVDVRGRDPITPGDLARVDLSRFPRVLLRTDAWTDPRRFPERIPVMSAELPAWLGCRGARLIGLDVPSVDALDSKTLPNHHALHKAEVAIIESLRLVDVAEGAYWLSAVPLSVKGGDGAPLRAVLRPESAD